MVIQTSSPVAWRGSVIYSLSLLFLFGVSAIYHRPHWEPRQRAFLKRLDHGAIFILIAGTATPVCLVGLPPEGGSKMLIIIWSSALLGLLQSIFWIGAPKWVSGILYVIMGWLIVPYLPELKATMDNNGLFLILLGGIAYTVGAVFYVFKKPNFFPGVFGYHELFHVMTVIGAALQFASIYKLITN